MPVTSLNQTADDATIVKAAWAQYHKYGVIKLINLSHDVFGRRIGGNVCDKLREVLEANHVPCRPRQTRNRKPKPTTDKLAKLSDWLDRETSKQHIKPHVVTVSLEGVAQS